MRYYISLSLVFNQITTNCIIFCDIFTVQTVSVVTILYICQYFHAKQNLINFNNCEVKSVLDFNLQGYLDENVE